MAGRLRIKNTFGKRAVDSQSTEVKSVYVISIASEGKTEEQYFDGIYDSETNNIVKIDRLEKEDENDTKSHPNHVISLLDERKEYWEEHGVDPNELWMVVDRDKQNVSEEQLNEIISRCSKNGYNLALSNPTFEFWLLLHIIDSNTYRTEDLLDNEKISKSKRFVEGELSKFLGGYSKKNLRFERFEPWISKAIERAKKLPTDNSSLINELGSSVCLLVEKVVK